MKKVIFIKMLSCICLLLLQSTLFSQHKKNIDWYELDVHHGKLFQPNTIAPYSGTAHEKFADGSKAKKVPIKDGKVHGTVEEWAMNGEKIAQLEYIMGTPQGMEKRWYESGKKKLEATYVNGVVDGVVTEWYKNGRKQSEGNFNQAIEEGDHTWWFNNGIKERMIPYKNGKASGLVKTWHFNGNKRLEGLFKEGLENGDFTEWFTNGTVSITGTYSMGKKNGIFKTYSKKGILLEQQTYDQGVLIEDLNYRSGNINWSSGYTQVFNGKESFYTVDITGPDVYPRASTQDIIYVVDRYFLQLLNTPVDLFQKTDLSVKDDQEILKNFVSFESKYIEEKSGKKIEVISKPGTTPNGIAYVHWHFKITPKENTPITPRTVKEEHYISLLCNQEVLSLYGLVTKVNDPEAVQKMMMKVANTTKIANERIELNALNRQLHNKH